MAAIGLIAGIWLHGAGLAAFIDVVALMLGAVVVRARGGTSAMDSSERVVILLVALVDVVFSMLAL